MLWKVRAAKRSLIAALGIVSCAACGFLTSSSASDADAGQDGSADANTDGIETDAAAEADEATASSCDTGGSVTLDPRTLGHLEVWYGADSVVADGGTVQEWPDLSSNGRVARVPTDCVAPRYATSDAGLPQVVFAGDDLTLHSCMLFPLGADPGFERGVTLVVVARVHATSFASAGSAHPFVRVGGAGETFYFLLGLYPDTYTLLYKVESKPYLRAPAVALDAWHIYDAVQQPGAPGLGATSTAVIHRDGVIEVDGPAIVPTHAQRDFNWIGRGENGYVNADFAAVLLFSQALSDCDMARLRASLAAQWNVTP